MNEAEHRYRNSPKGRAAIKRRKALYYASPKGRAWQYKYNRSPERKAVLKRWRNTPEFKASRRARHLKETFGLTLAEYDAMLISQKNVCAICAGAAKGRWQKLHVDHDHKTGKIRGLLCHDCNVVLGFSRENSGTLWRAIEYLEDRK